MGAGLCMLAPAFGLLHKAYVREGLKWETTDFTDRKADAQSPAHETPEAFSTNDGKRK